MVGRMGGQVSYMSFMVREVVSRAGNGVERGTEATEVCTGAVEIDRFLFGRRGRVGRRRYESEGCVNSRVAGVFDSKATRKRARGAQDNQRRVWRD
jgi:hypothetical protein